LRESSLSYEDKIHSIENFIRDIEIESFGLGQLKEMIDKIKQEVSDTAEATADVPALTNQMASLVEYIESIHLPVSTGR